jgi:hypothetical protein
MIDFLLKQYGFWSMGLMFFLIPLSIISNIFISSLFLIVKRINKVRWIVLISFLLALIVSLCYISFSEGLSHLFLFKDELFFQIIPWTFYFILVPQLLIFYCDELIRLKLKNKDMSDYYGFIILKFVLSIIIPFILGIIHIYIGTQILHITPD